MVEIPSRRVAAAPPPRGPWKEALKGALGRSPWRAPRAERPPGLSASGSSPRAEGKQDLVRCVAEASLLQSLTVDPMEGSFQVQGLGSTYLPDVVQRRLRPPPGGLLFLFSSSLISSLELNDTKVHEPYIRALLGTTAHSCRGSFQVLRVWRSSVACRVWRFSLRV
jgi:hypothetical protein